MTDMIEEIFLARKNCARHSYNKSMNIIMKDGKDKIQRV